MKANKLSRKVFILIMAALFLVSPFVSCKKQSGSSFISYLDQIDIYISVGNTRDAMEELKNLEKKAHTSLERLGVYKRYLTLGEKQRAEKFILASIKKLPQNIELKAAYVHFLLRENRLEEALKLSTVLEDTKYSSLHAEALLRNASENKLSAEWTFNPPKKKNKKNQPDPEEVKNCFMDPRFIPYYISSYQATDNSLWLKDAALLYVQSGEYTKAASLVPDSKKMEFKDTYFWSSILYDAGLFPQALDLLLEFQQKWVNDFDSLKSMALTADCLYILGEDQEAQNLRERMLAMDVQALTSQQAQEILPVVYLDSAIYARIQDDIVSEYILSKDLVDYYPDYESGLAFYAQFALETLRRPPEEELLQRIRRSGLRTQSMEKYDLIPGVALEDAVQRIEDALAREKKPELVVLKEKLYEETHPDLMGGEKIGRVWKLLEDNEMGTNLYPSSLIRFAVATMVSHSAADEASDLFNRFLENNHGIAIQDIFDPQVHVSLSLWEYEMAAWFYKDIDVKKARQLYEKIISDYGSRTPGNVTSGQNSTVMRALVNLSVIEGGYSNNEESYALLNMASGKAVDSSLKAEILFRMAELDVERGDFHSAIRSLKYAIQLNNSHNRARLLLKTLNGSF